MVLATVHLFAISRVTQFGQLLRSDADLWGVSAKAIVILVCLATSVFWGRFKAQRAAQRNYLKVLGLNARMIVLCTLACYVLLALLLGSSFIFSVVHILATAPDAESLLQVLCAGLAYSSMILGIALILSAAMKRLPAWLGQDGSGGLAPIVTLCVATDVIVGFRVAGELELGGFGVPLASSLFAPELSWSRVVLMSAGGAVFMAAGRLLQNSYRAKPRGQELATGSSTQTPIWRHMLTRFVYDSTTVQDVLVVSILSVLCLVGARQLILREVPGETVGMATTFAAVFLSVGFSQVVHGIGRWESYQILGCPRRLFVTERLRTIAVVLAVITLVFSTCAFVLLGSVELTLRAGGVFICCSLVVFAIARLLGELGATVSGRVSIVSCLSLLSLLVQSIGSGWPATLGLLGISITAALLLDCDVQKY